MNARTAPVGVSTTTGLWLVAEREILTKIRSRSYLISAAFLLLIVIGGIVFSAINSGDPGKITVAVTSDVSAQVPESAVLTVVSADSVDAARQLVTDGKVDAAVIADADSPTGTKIIGAADVPSGLTEMLSVSPPVELLDPNGASPLRFILGLMFGLVFMLAAMTFGTPIAMSVVEEKQTRVVEILLSAVPARAMLAGKVLGNTILAMAQIALLLIVAIVGLSVTGQSALLAGLSAPLLWFAVFFLFGFILLGSLFAAVGSMVSRQEDIQPLLTPLVWITVVPYMLTVFFGDNPVVMTVMSYVPFSAAVAMPVRLYFGDALWWEPLISLVVLLVSCVAIIALGARIYENSLLRMGARVSFKDALGR